MNRKDKKLIRKFLKPYKDEFLSQNNQYPLCQNLVATVDFATSIILRDITDYYPWAQFIPKKFAAVKYRLYPPRSTCLIFQTGKMVCVGTKTVESARFICHIMRKILSALNYETGFETFGIVNRVYSSNFKRKLDLMKLYKNPGLLEEGNGQGCEYDPEAFPGMTYAWENPSFTLMIFDSGAMNWTGIKHHQDVLDVYKIMLERIDGITDTTANVKNLNKSNLRKKRKKKVEDSFFEDEK